MWDYTDKVREHYLHPRNVGEIEKPDGVGEVGNLKCGDALRLTFKLDEEGKIAEVKFKTFGCGSAIASSSILTELVKGKTIEEAKKITNQDIASALGGLPPAKMHCSVMGQEALQKAIEFYVNRGKPEYASQVGDAGHLVCSCFNVTDKEIENAIRVNNLTSVEEVTNFTKAGGGCGGCVPEIEAIIERVKAKNEAIGKQASPEKRPSDKTNESKSRPSMTMLEKIDRIRAVLTTDIRPSLQKDGGDLELVDVVGDDVLIRFKGHCSGCVFSRMTQFEFIEKILREKVVDTLHVKEVTQ